MRSRFAALLLLVGIAPFARAGEIRARIEGPGPDGVTYTVRTLDLQPTDTLEPWAHAEGVVEGKSRSVLLRVRPTDEHGVYQFTRAWPEEGRWMIRLSLGHPPAPATVATLRADGTVKRQQYFHQSDGSWECHRALKGLVKGGDDC